MVILILKASVLKDLQLEIAEHKQYTHPGADSTLCRSRLDVSNHDPPTLKQLCVAARMLHVACTHAAGSDWVPSLGCSTKLT
jgi:hypothetical protein